MQLGGLGVTMKEATSSRPLCPVVGFPDDIVQWGSMAIFTPSGAQSKVTDSQTSKYLEGSVFSLFPI